MRSAIVHDWLTTLGGAEKVLESIDSLFPSPIYTLVQSQKKLKNSYFEDKKIISSFLQKWPFAETKYRNYFPFFPLAIEQFDLREYDLILSSSHCVAKGALTNPDQLHICYCHTPVRYAWDLMHEYLEQSELTKGFKSFLIRWCLHNLRNWDALSAKRVDHFIANSYYVASRISKFYGCKARVIYPPVETGFFQLVTKKDEYYFTASRFVPYKKIDLIVEAFSAMPDKKLVVIGDGPDWKKVKAKAGKNIELMGSQPNKVLKEYMQKAKAFVFAAVEDFGILPVEAMACGTPVIAFGKGAITETVENGVTGLFFDEQTVPSIQQAVQQFEQQTFDPIACRARAELFSRQRFDREFYEYVTEKLHESSHISRRRGNSPMALV